MQKLAFTSAALFATLFAVSGAQSQTMNSTDVKAAQDSISADYKAAKAACDGMAGNAKDICVEEAKGKEKVAKAELAYQRSGKPADMGKAAMAKAEADYAVAKERCDDKSGNEKEVCRKEAKAAETSAKAKAKTGAGKT